MSDDKMTSAEITDALMLAAKQRERDTVKDNAIDKLGRMFKHMSALEQMQAITAYQCALILEIANYDHKQATPVFQASWALACTMINDMHQAAVEADEAVPVGVNPN